MYLLAEFIFNILTDDIGPSTAFDHQMRATSTGKEAERVNVRRKCSVSVT